MTERINLGGVTNTTLHQESDGTLIVEEKQDCESILDHNQRRRDHQFGQKGEFREVANIPMTAYLEECRRAGATMFSKEADAVMERMLQDPKYAKFLAAPSLHDPHIIITGAR